MFCLVVPPSLVSLLASARARFNARACRSHPKEMKRTRASVANWSCRSNMRSVLERIDQFLKPSFEDG